MPSGFFGDLGHFYKTIGIDSNRCTTIDCVVYGVPETVLVGPDSKVAFKNVGLLSPEFATKTSMLTIEKALAAQ